MASDWPRRQAFMTRDSHIDVMRHPKMLPLLPGLLRIQGRLRDRIFEIIAFHVSHDSVTES
jgi:hypothetical protein